ncbi:uncharacterized protein LOC125087264 [Lutra lutra]|uniref:uncharacterized protein LOC125087264 n=1 Tax=Lutra lutra TaxID=9657 RepID=UPI001FD05E51|nr:uncharacterized protein LOC125087264 [Lutra lutra]
MIRTEISPLPPAFFVSWRRCSWRLGSPFVGPGETLRSCHGDQTRTSRVEAGRGNAAAADWPGSHAVAQRPRDFGVRRRIAFRAERCGVVCLGVYVGIPARFWSADPRAELPVFVYGRARLISRTVPRPGSAATSRTLQRGRPGALRLRYGSIHQLTAVAPGEAARPGRCRPGVSHRGAATRAPRTGGGLGPSAAVGRPSPAVSTVGAWRATDRGCPEEPVPPGGWGSRERGGMFERAQDSVWSLWSLHRKKLQARLSLAKAGSHSDGVLNHCEGISSKVGWVPSRSPPVSFSCFRTPVLV